MAITKPTAGASGWNTAVDQVIDKVNTLAAGGVTVGGSATSVTLDADSTRGYRLVATADVAVNVPSGGVDGQEVVVEVQASGAARAVTVAAGVEVSEAAPSRTVRVPAGGWGTVKLRRRGSVWRLVHADPLGLPGPDEWTLADFGLVAATANPGVVIGTGALTAGQVRLSRLRVAVPVTVSAVVCVVSTAGTGITDGYLGLYDSGFGRLAVTASDPALFASTGVKSGALTAPVALTPGDYYAAGLAVGTTGPTLQAGASALMGAVGRTGSNYLGLLAGAGAVALPTTAAPGGATTHLWFGLG